MVLALAAASGAQEVQWGAKAGIDSSSLNAVPDYYDWLLCCHPLFPDARVDATSGTGFTAVGFAEWPIRTWFGVQGNTAVIVSALSSSLSAQWPLHQTGKESPMAETKTKPTNASVDEYLASRASAEQLKDCKAIMAICKRVTKQQPKMWGPSIVGYGSYTYRYESGHSGQSCLAAFAIRGRDLVVYIMGDEAKQAKLLTKLGKHKMGVSCLYFKRLADLDAKVLEALIAGSVAEAKRRYPQPRDA